MLNRVALLIAVMLGTMGTCKADTMGPLAFGNNSPFGTDGATSPISLGSGIYIAPLLGSGININGIGQNLYFDYIVSFTYDLAPGWTIDNLFLSNFVDFGAPGKDSDWGFAFSEKVILCPTVGSCSTATTGAHGGQVTLPPVYLGATATAGTGVYEIAGWANDTQFATNGGIQNLNVFMSPVPEPDSIFLMAVGVVGLPLFQYFRKGRK